MSHLTNEGINRACEEVQAFLRAQKADRAETIRLPMMLEEALLTYRAHLGADTGFSLKTSKVPGRIRITVLVPGESLDPFTPGADDDYDLLRKLNTEAGTISQWSFRNGINRISFSVPKTHKLSSSTKTLLAIALAIPLGIVLSRLPAEIRTGFLEGFLAPTIKTIMGIITAVAGPMIFFSLVWGICTIGDVESLSRIGKRLIGSYVLGILVLTVLSSFIFYLFCSSAAQGHTAFRISDFYQMILGIFPGNMLEPFVSGNSQQLIFLAVIGGITLLTLGERVSSVTTLVGHLNCFLQQVMTMANTLIPFMAFFCMLQLIMAGQFRELVVVYKYILLFLGISLFVMAAFTIAVMLRQGVRPFLLARKAMPAFILASITASSPASLSVCIDSCKGPLGMDEKIVNFGVPLGQTLFKPGSMIRFVMLGFCMADIYDVPVSLNWLAVCILTCFLLSLSAPPVPGGATICFAVLFSQLGIPADAIGLSLALNALLDYPLTGVNLYCLQMELVDIAGVLNLLDKERLRTNAAG